MGIDPSKLEKSHVTISGISGNKLTTQTRQMCIKIVNNKTGTESWEKVYISPEKQTPLLLKDCLIRLKVINPDNFLSDEDIQSSTINSVEEKKSKLSECEKTFYTKDNGDVGCACSKRRDPPRYMEEPLLKAFDDIKKRVEASEDGDLSGTLANYLKHVFRASSMNTCQTQALSMMQVPKMTVEFKKDSEAMRPYLPKTVRISGFLTGGLEKSSIWTGGN